MEVGQRVEGSGVRECRPSIWAQTRALDVVICGIFWLNQAGICAFGAVGCRGCEVIRGRDVVAMYVKESCQ